MATTASVKAVRAIPEGYYSLTPALTVHNAAEAIEFYKKAFGARELARMASPDGKQVWHAELEIGNSRFMLADEFPDMDGSHSPKSVGAATGSIHIYVEDADVAFKQALYAGATVAMPLMD